MFNYILTYEKEKSAQEDDREKEFRKMHSSAYFMPSKGIITRGKDQKPDFVIKDYFQDENGNEETPEKYVDHENKNKLKEVWDRILDYIKWEEKAFHEKVMFIFIESFWTLIRSLSIPRIDEDWNKYFNSLVPIFAPLVVLFSIGSFECAF